MFNNYTQALAQLFRVKEVPRQYSQILMNVLARCDGELDFRGDLTVNNLTVRGGLPGSNNYAIATGTWVRASGHGSYVTCRAASDPIGTLTSDATTFRVYLPRSSADKDPNVYAGDILQYVTVGGTNYAIGESYLDAKIGSLKAMTINDTGMNGWTKCDGGGSTVDHTNKFVRGNATTYGTPGGSDTHTHTGSITVDNKSLDIIGTTATGEANIPDHPDHVHKQSDVCHILAVGGDYYGYATDDPHYTEGVLDAISKAPLTLEHIDSGHDHDAGTLAVDPNPHNHTGSVSIDSANNIPAYINVIWYVRTGPSGEIT